MDEDLDSTIYQTAHECAGCTESILLTDEIFMLTVVQPVVLADGSFHFFPVTDNDGDFLYGPRTVELSCWETAVEELLDTLADVPPFLDSRAILDCSFCKSGIRLYAHTGLATFGELQCSVRCPDGTATAVFQAMDPNPQVACGDCLRKLDDDYLALWGMIETGNR